MQKTPFQTAVETHLRLLLLLVLPNHDLVCLTLTLKPEMGG